MNTQLNTITMTNKYYSHGEKYNLFKGLYDSNGDKIYDTIREDLICLKYIHEETGLIYNAQLGVRILFNGDDFDSVEFNKDDLLEYFNYSKVQGNVDCDYFDNLEQIIINHVDSDIMSHADYEL